MERRVVLLHPIGPHNSPITSQTLFGATCWALAALGEDVGTLLSGFVRGGTRFAFGSAFPYLGGKEKPILLLPRPRFRIPAPAVEEKTGTTETEIKNVVGKAKEIQKVSYISAAVAEHLQKGQMPGELLSQVLDDTVVFGAGAMLTREEHEAIWRHADRKKDKDTLITSAYIQRNSVDRMVGATVEGALFQEEQTFYCPGRSGLWAGIAADAGLWPKLEAAFRYLSDTGLGSERTLGKGHFYFEWLKWETFFPAAPSAKRFINLGQYIPAAPDEAMPLAYELLAIRQKAENRYPSGSPRVYTAALRAFAPGGVFEAAAPQAVYGRLVELGQIADRTVYYSGATLPLWGAWEVGV